jgi:hypothetical protein
MNHASHIIGNAASVATRLTSENGSIRPEKLMDILCFNNTGGTLYMQYHDNKSSLAGGEVPLISFAVQGGLGGTLGRGLDVMGGICAWSTTQATYTAAGASGAINPVIKG